MEKTKSLLEKNWMWSALAFGIPFVVAVLICAAAGMYPFGENCMLHIDMYHQYCPFFMEFWEKLHEGGSLLYTWNLGLGTDFFATYVYYLASPLNWLLFLWPQGLVIEFMTFTIILKIGLAGLFFFWFLKERYELVGADGKYHLDTAAPALVFAFAYAFSGFVATYSWNIMWMDGVALAPLIVLGLERLVKKQKPALYYISLSLAILCNFYIAMIICIFLVFYFLILFLEKRGGELKAFLSFAWYSLLAGGTGAVFLIPEAISLGYSSSSDNTLPETMEWYFGIVEELSRLCLTASPYTGNDHWPNLYCGTFTVLLVCMYVFNTRVKWSEKIPKLVFIGFFIVSFANNYLDVLWHGLRYPRSLPGRQSFLFVFMMLLVAYECFRKRKGNKIWHVLVSVAICIALLVAGASLTDEAVTEKTAFLLTGIFVICYALCFLVYRLGIKKMRVMIMGFAFGIAMGEIIIHMGVTGFYSLSRTAYLSKMDDYKAIIEMAETDAAADAPDGTALFYRLEDTERKTKNDSALYGYPAGTVFSTIMNIEVSHFYQRVFMEGGANYYCYNGATPIFSSMLAVRYYISDNPDGENALRTLVGSKGNYYLYENNYYLPLGFVMSEEAVENWNNNTGSRITNINGLGYVLGATGNMLYYPPVGVEEAPGETTIYIADDGVYYAYYDNCNSSTLTIRKNGGVGTTYGKTTHRYLFELGECKEGDEITISNGNNEEISFSVLKLNMDALDEAYKTLSQSTMVTEKYSDTEIVGHIDVKEAGRFILSIPAEEGWKLYVDGKETAFEAFKDAFISVHLDEGQHQIELKYVTPGLLEGTLLSAGCILLFVISMGVSFWWKKRSEKASVAKAEEIEDIQEKEVTE